MWIRVVTGIAYTGAAAIVLHPLRSLVTTACLLAVLVPYVVGIGISKGVERDADLSLQFGADIYVSAVEFGRETALPQAMMQEVQSIEGVRDVTPRIVGPIKLGSNREEAVLVGIPPEKLPQSVTCVAGRLFSPSHIQELVLGSELARRLKLEVGDHIPPFHRSSQGERVSKVVGIFKSDVSLWQAKLIFTSLETAQAIFDQPAEVTALLVNCQLGYEDSVREQIQRKISSTGSDSNRRLRPRVITREEIAALLPRSLLHREGIFNLHFALVIVVGILVTLVTSGTGLSERRREVGVLKATGWQTDEVILRSLVEGVLLSLIGSTFAILLAWGWLRFFNGFWIASLFLTGVDAFPHFSIPFQLTPVPALLAVIISLVMVLSGTLYATWRSATVSPGEAMR